MVENRIDFVSAFLLSLLASIGNPTNFKPKKVIGRAIFFLFLAYGLIVSNLFQSATVTSMTNKYYKTQVSSLEEAVLNNFEFAGTGYSLEVLQSQHNEVKISVPIRFTIESFFFYFSDICTHFEKLQNLQENICLSSRIVRKSKPCCCCTREIR